MTIGLTVFAVTALFVGRRITMVICKSCQAEDDVKSLGRLMGISSGYDHLAGRDYAETIAKLRVLVEKHGAPK